MWTDGRPDEFALVAGKIHNLRVALPAFDRVEIPAGAVLSFWQQLGKPSRRRGFVVGREIRGGCVVPTIAGGICQISNALATCAELAGFELVERHAHSARIEHQANRDGGPAQIDATVFWNYIDLRIRSTHPWRIELEMTSSEMVLRRRCCAPGGGDREASPEVRAWKVKEKASISATAKHFELSESTVKRYCTDKAAQTA